MNSKATVVLAYANWEGFYNECVDAYIRFLRDRGGKIRDTDWMLLLGAFHADFESLKARDHSYDARRQFVEDLQARLECSFDSSAGGKYDVKLTGAPGGDPPSQESVEQFDPRLPNSVFYVFHIV